MINFIDTTPNFDIEPKFATLMPIDERVQVIEGTSERIFDDEFVQVLMNNRIVKVKKESLVYA